MAFERFFFLDAIGAFAPGQPLRAALVLTYSFDGRWFEDVVVPDLFERPVATALLVRDRQALLAEAPSVRYHRTDAAFSTHVFHPKLALFVAEDRARVIIGSANMTRGGLEQNLELGSAFDISSEGGSRSVFKALLAYISGPLRRETDGGSLRALDDIVVALREVVAHAPAEHERPNHILLHNYERSLWDQLLAKLPHRLLRRAVVVSPFYEPDIAKGRSEDPPGQAEDTSIFNRLFSDFVFDADEGEIPVTVCFQEDYGETALPLSKLKAWKDRLNLRARLATSDDGRPLHGKLLVLEGTGRKGREPFLAAIHGSPNFTSAAFLTTPPDGNAELAILTWLPPRGGGANRVEASLGLGELFGPIIDWETIHSKAPAKPSQRDRNEFVLTDATFQVVGQTLVVSVRNVPAGAARFRLTAEVDGTWTLLADGDWGEHDTISVSVTNLATTDPETTLLTLRASRVRLEIMTNAGNSLAVADAPLNVDCPEQFCGLAMVGPLLLTLDQRIAHAGAGIPTTYREQQKWLERLRQERGAIGLPVPTHQADLDKFFRNLHTGLKGLRRRLDAAPRSEFTLRNALRQLSSWCSEAVASDGKVASDECRAFLLDHLAREMLVALDRASGIPAVASGMSAMVVELGLRTTIEAAQSWLAAVCLPDATAYLRKTRKRFSELQQMLGRQ